MVTLTHRIRLYYAMVIEQQHLVMGSIWFFGPEGKQYYKLASQIFQIIVDIIVLCNSVFNRDAIISEGILKLMRSKLLRKEIKAKPDSCCQKKGNNPKDNGFAPDYIWHVDLSMVMNPLRSLIAWVYWNRGWSWSLMKQYP